MGKDGQNIVESQGLIDKAVKSFVNKIESGELKIRVEHTSIIDEHLVIIEYKGEKIVTKS